MSKQILLDNVEMCKEVKYPIVEMFDSIQGEGAMMGMPVTFIRTAGCNLACPWCDTKESWGKKPDYDEDQEQIEAQVKKRNSLAEKLILGYEWLSVEQIVEKVGQNIVVITGGEPCMHELRPLIEILHLNDIMVNIETNGTLPTPANADWVVCSPKPGNQYQIHEQCFAGEYKFVVTPDFKVEDIPAFLMEAPYGKVWLQPEGGNMHDMWQKAYDLTMEYPCFRVGVQLHKIIDVK